jgi:glutathione S-transferase
MKLYADPMACSLASHVALVASGLPHQVSWVQHQTWYDPQAKRTDDGRDFLGVNPKGVVPALELDDGTVLTEGSAILQYIGDRAPQSGLVPPAGSIERYRLQEWLNYIATELHKAVFILHFGADRQKLLPAAELKQYALELLDKRFDYLEQKLRGRRYLHGEAFSAADAYMLVIINWAMHLKVDLSRWPALAAYGKGLQQHPAVREVQQREREQYLRNAA